MVSRRPQGAFVAGGARRRRLSWSRPPAARLWSVGGMRRSAGLALRANTKRRGAPFTKARWRGTRKRSSCPSKHESASPRPRREGASRRKEREKRRSKEQVVRSKCGGQRLVVFCLPTQQKTNLPHLRLTPFCLPLLSVVCRHNRRRTFRTYSLPLTPYSLSPFSFVAREAHVCSLWQKPTR